jgi:hypothetical protein
LTEKTAKKDWYAKCMPSPEVSMRAWFVGVAFAGSVVTFGCGGSGSSSTGGSAGEPGTGGSPSDGGSGATTSDGGATNGGAGVGGASGCPPEFLGDGQFCDCFCGMADPDCTNPDLPLYGDEFTQCAEGQTCSPTFDGCDGLPTGWTCAEDQYNGGPGNGCDCNCGLSDPDCLLDPAEPVEGCMGDEQCGGDGVCVPGAWSCDPSYFGDMFCDCGCGVADPDCPDATVGSCEYCMNVGSCSSMECPGTINPTNNAVCN